MPSHKYSKSFLVNLYETMIRIRLCEESLVEPILKRDVICPCHLYSGEEAIATGICAALTQRDYVFGSHRSHGHYLAKGGGLKELVAEIYCKESGCSRGRGGSMHVVAVEQGMIGSAPIVAGTISLALGAALAAKIRRDKRVAVSFFGDGATGEGVLYESLNFAAVHRLPIIFVCENNYYSTHMPIQECRPPLGIVKIGEPFGIRSFATDGNDVLQVYETGKKAVRLCQRGKGPALVECLTYRLRGHVGPDDNIQGQHADIRPKEEIERWKLKDPIKNFEKFLLRQGLLKKQNLENIRRKIEEEVEIAHAFAKASPAPEEKAVARYVFK